MEDLIIIVVLAVIISLAAGYIYRSKKKGHKCIGCPEGTCSCGSPGMESGCGGGCQGCSGCGIK